MSTTVANEPPSPDVVKSQQLFQARMKAHDVVQEHLKQIVTVASATLVLTVTFVKDIVGTSESEASASWLLPSSWIVLGISIVLAVLSIALLVNNLDKADETPGKDGKYAKAFAASAIPLVRFSILASILTFGFGMISLGSFGALNYQLFLRKDSKAYKVLSETQAVEQAKKQLPSNVSLVNLTKIELLKGSDKLPESMLVWHVQLTIKQQSTSSEGVPSQVLDYYVDAFTGNTHAGQ